MGILFIIILVCLLAIPIGIYNKLIGLRQRVKNAWAQIDVQLKRRHDLIPNLVEVAKGYMTHERETLEKVIQARNMAQSAQGVKGKGEAENFLSGTLKSLFAVVESYPNLKADSQMLSLQEELTTTENKISFARQHYNDENMRFNTQIEVFPSNIIAGTFNFTKGEFFEIEDQSQKEAPKVQF
ncbi:MAG: LemA family protein [Candidatus Omnitrophica bacterium]|nr:LemA family protein [Candidatus Omnitrophota bacterium]